MFLKETMKSQLQKPIELDQVSQDQRRIAQDSFTCGVCFNIMSDPVCCANESCNYMLCKAHVTPDMRCPNRCSDHEPLKTIKVQRVILNQLMNLTVKCDLCHQLYEIGDRETHYAKYCQELIFERCLFSDCKLFEPCKREAFEQHIYFNCASKEKQCQTCELDIFKMYENERFRQSSHGHICSRDRLMLLWETLVDQNEESEENLSEADDESVEEEEDGDDQSEEDEEVKDNINKKNKSLQKLNEN